MLGKVRGEITSVADKRHQTCIVLHSIEFDIDFNWCDMYKVSIA